MEKKLGWRVSEFAQAMGISRTKAYEVLAAHPELVFRIGSSIRVAPERAEQWRDEMLARQVNGLQLLNR